MAWLEVHQSLCGHRKTRAAAKALGMTRPQLVGHVLFIWLWALDNAPDGNLDSIGSDVIADVAEYDGDADEFYGALVKVGFIDQTASGDILHDWEEYAGKLIDRRKSNAEKQRRFRESQRESHADVTLRDAHVTDTSPSRDGATVQNTTVPNTPCNPAELPESETLSLIPEEQEEKAAPFEAEFNAAWAHYPRKLDRLSALAQYQARRRAGVPAKVLADATLHYAATCQREGKAARHIMHGDRFFGKYKPYEDYISGELVEAGAGAPASSGYVNDLVL